MRATLTTASLAALIAGLAPAAALAATAQANGTATASIFATDTDGGAIDDIDLDFTGDGAEGSIETKGVAFGSNEDEASQNDVLTLGSGAFATAGPGVGQSVVTSTNIGDISITNQSEAEQTIRLNIDWTLAGDAEVDPPANGSALATGSIAYNATSEGPEDEFESLFVSGDLGEDSLEGLFTDDITLAGLRSTDVTVTTNAGARVDAIPVPAGLPLLLGGLGALAFLHRRRRKA